MEQALREFRDVVGRDHVVVDASIRSTHELDWTGRFAGSTPAVLRPGSTAEVEGIVAVCRRLGVAIVAQGGNTGMVGGGVPLHGEVVVDLRRLQRLDAIDTLARQVTVGAGVSVETVQRAAEAAGLRYAVDFGARATATIGGSVATNAGGVNVIRHGATREQVLGIEAVLGTGQSVSRLHGLEKDNTGYHLPGLLCGSEGTLGLITAVRVRLVTLHRERVTALVGFESVRAAVAAVAMWRSSLDSLDAAELMLADGIGLVCATFELASPLERLWPAVVLVEASGHLDPTPAVAEAVASAVGVTEVAVASDSTRRRAMWRLRDDQTLAVSTVGVPHKFDVTVPVAALAQFVEAVPTVVREVAPNARTWIFGHVGDGNLHVNVTGMEGVDADIDGEHLDERVYRLAVGFGGCISAEHGIGTAKAKWLPLDRSENEIAAMRAIKRALDPLGILNPHAVVPPTIES